MIKGYASPQGTDAYFKEKGEKENTVSNGRYRYSKLGLGTFIGDFSDETSALFRETIEYALLNGVNFIDAAINYRGMRSERDIGMVITRLIEEGRIQRNQFVISSKAGIIPGDGELMQRPIHYMQENLLNTGILNEEDVYMEETLWLTMHPAYFNYALDVSRKHMNLETIDIYYMHELELSMKHYGAEEFYRRLRDVIAAYEQMVSDGKIREYGMATWDAFQLEETHEQYISLERVMEAAESVSPNHHLKHLMLPVNLQNRDAVEKKTQKYKEKRLSIVECAKEYDLEVHVSGSLGQGEAADSEAVERYLSYLVRESGCRSYFTGTKRIGHLKENMAAVRKAISCIDSL